MSVNINPRDLRETAEPVTPIPAAMLDELAIISHEVSKLARGTAEDVAQSIATISQAAHHLREIHGNGFTCPRIAYVNGELIEAYQPDLAALVGMLEGCAR